MDYNQQRPYQQQPYQQYPPQQPVYIVQRSQESNGIGTAGFILALLDLLFCWAPIVNIVFWLLGFIFSFIGLFKRPKGLAIAGFVISLISIVVVLVIVAMVGGVALSLGGLSGLF